MKVEVKSALISAAVALVVAAPMSSAAHEGVSSAVKVLRGKQGKTGKQGPTGPVGPRGERGRDGRDATAIDKFSSSLIYPGERRTYMARCAYPADAFGGGIDTASWPAAAGPVTVLREGVGDVGEWKPAYFAVVENTGNNAAIVQAAADCA